MTSLKTLIALEIQAGHIDNINTCPHNFDGQYCSQVFYKPTAEWMEFPMDDKLHAQFSSRTCPEHRLRELADMERYRHMKNYLEWRK